jgi:ribonuclease HepT-like protein
MRDHLAHRYFDTAHSILQATVDQDLPALEQAIHALIRSLPDEGPTTLLTSLTRPTKGSLPSQDQAVLSSS